MKFTDTKEGEWAKKVANSNGNLVMITKEDLKARWKENERMKKDVDDLANKFNKLNSTFMFESTVMFRLMKESLEEKYPDIWSKELHIVMDAVKDGVLIAEVREPVQR